MRSSWKVINPPSARTSSHDRTRGGAFLSTWAGDGGLAAVTVLVGTEERRKICSISAGTDARPSNTSAKCSAIRSSIPPACCGSILLAMMNCLIVFLSSTERRSKMSWESSWPMLRGISVASLLTAIFPVEGLKLACSDKLNLNAGSTEKPVIPSLLN